MSTFAPIDCIDRSPWADLFEHPEEHIERLAADIKERGIQTPLHVYPRGERFELLTGHDRLEAAKRAGLDKVPVEKRSTLADEDARFEHFLKDNALRKDIDKRAAAKAAWLRWPDSKVKDIADRSGVSVGTAHAARSAAEAEAPDKFSVENTRTDAIGRERPRQYKPRPSDPESSDGADLPDHVPGTVSGERAEGQRKMREQQAPGSATWPEPEDEHGPRGLSWTEDEHGLKTCDDCGKTWNADLEYCPYCNISPEARAKHVAQQDADDAPKRRVVPKRRPYTARMKALVNAALDARDADDEEIANIPSNDLMLQGLREARDLLTRVIEAHSKETTDVSA